MLDSQTHQQYIHIYFKSYYDRIVTFEKKRRRGCFQFYFSYRKIGDFVSVYPGQPAQERTLRRAGTFNKIRGPPKRCFLVPASRIWKRIRAVLVRIETYTIVESNSEFFIPLAVAVICVVSRHRDPPSTSQSVTSTFPPLCRESRFAITIAQIYEQLSLDIY